MSHSALVQTKADERNGVLSADGRWLAYDSNMSGQPEVYVRPFPNVESGLWLISSGGGSRPLWSKGGRELFYLSPNCHPRVENVVRPAGLEPATPGLGNRCSILLSYGRIEGTNYQLTNGLWPLVASVFEVVLKASTSCLCKSLCKFFRHPHARPRFV
jgi:hypothetical protein